MNKFLSNQLHSWLHSLAFSYLLEDLSTSTRLQHMYYLVIIILRINWKWNSKKIWKSQQNVIEFYKMIEFPKMKYNAKSPSHSYLILLSRRKISPFSLSGSCILLLSSFSIEASIVLKYFQVPYYWEGSQLNHFVIKSYLYHFYKRCIDVAALTVM